VVIKRFKRLYVVYKGHRQIFKSYHFDDCVDFVKDNGGFYEARKKIKTITKKD
jgi:hypothetical protein